MKKMKFLMAAMISAVIFTACENKYSVDNLKKNDKLLKETAQKCKIKRNEKICINVDKAQAEKAQEWWNKVKPEVTKKVDKVAKDLMAGDPVSSMEIIPEKLWEWEAKHGSTTPQKAKEMALQILKVTIKKIKFEKVEYNVENAKIGQTSAGRNYVIIPTKSIVSGQGKKVELNPKSLVFEDGDKLYMVNIDEKNKTILTEMYSDLADIKVE
ncbi:EexN family lipoprotein [Leptotrichia sp. oral taxon 879]|uniref:EexN family lipoprotein n=1 Tax=Leptotrichia sp. oral taxon 879 TaxID=1227267 RepID=UPI0003ADDAB3|nr:EexN family lipoprotein [Leptotrichia sp. oral taxon 879]ERK48015.1 hypothetical protein HMPREF1552_02209 [Leptotrichia sp. oral taxon 879 str. F0557]